MRVLITGGTGFFGRGFVRKLIDEGLADRICVYSRDEYKQATMRQQFNNDPRLRFFIGDVRDQYRLEHAMHGVDTVVHAAALKRIEVCAYNVLECVATNVVGTENVVKASIRAGVKKAVMLNTDKATAPTTTYGFSKALAERIFLDANHYRPLDGCKFASCLYGNIAGSTGSVIPTWREILRTCNVVPVTDPDATRFWMYAHEAADLVLYAIDKMQGGEVFTPDLPAYRVGDLATAMSAQMRIIGLAENEKLHEEMRPGETSDKAKRMSVNELKEALQSWQLEAT